MVIVFLGKLKVAVYICLLVMFTSLVNVTITLAAGTGFGSGDGSGNGEINPLAYMGAILEDGGKLNNGATDIPLNPKIRLEFDKNVVNNVIWANNSQCISLKSSNNENIVLSVTKIDDTVDFNFRQFIFVQPTASLQPETSYQLSISPDLMAKNGVSTLGGTTNGQVITVSFKTQGESIQEIPSPATANDSKAAAAQVVLEQGAEEPQKGGFSKTTWVVIGGVVLVIVWVVVEFITRKRKK